MLILLVQVFVGQKWIENTEPFSGPVKSTDPVFAVFDFYNDVFMAPFHYGVTFLLRMDIRLDLRGKSDVELRKIMDRTRKTP